MKVWIGYGCSFDGCNMFEEVERVFDCEVKAYLWRQQGEVTEYYWRDVEERKVE